MKRIAIFASGSGTNAQNIIKFFAERPGIEVSLVLSNIADAQVLIRAKKLKVDVMSFNRPTFFEQQEILNVLKMRKIDLIVLAGFLWLVPDYLLKEYHNRIINIHPALLPKYGGKGMFGMRVHEAVIDSGDTESGITIHYVNEKYDEGLPIFQAKCKVQNDDLPANLAQKIHQLEYEHFPRVIEKLILEMD